MAFETAAAGRPWRRTDRDGDAAGAERRSVAGGRAPGRDGIRPGGYHWAPELGDEVLVLKTGESGEKTCAAGVPVEGTVKPGEVLITGRKCSLRLGLDGTVFVTGLLVVNGTQVGPPPPDDREG